MRQVEPSQRIPHGIRYSLTLHDRNNRRVFGIDNAHSFKPKRKRFGAGKTTWDHLHHKEKVAPYDKKAGLSFGRLKVASQGEGYG